MRQSSLCCFCCFCCFLIIVPYARQSLLLHGQGLLPKLSNQLPQRFFSAQKCVIFYPVLSGNPAETVKGRLRFSPQNWQEQSEYPIYPRADHEHGRRLPQSDILCPKSATGTGLWSVTRL